MQGLLFSARSNKAYLPYPVVTNYARLASYYSSHSHFHQVYHIVYIIEGKGWLDTDNGRVVLEKEKIIIINPGAKHIFITRKSQLFYYAFNFYLVPSPDLKKKKDFQQNGFSRAFLEKHGEQAPLERLFDITARGIYLDYAAESWFSIINYIRNFQYAVSDHVSSLYVKTRTAPDQTWYLHHCFNFLDTMFFNFFKAGSGPDNRETATPDALVQKVTGYLENRLSEKLDLAALAESVGYNASYLSSLFRQRSGMTLGDHFNKMKVRAACEQLKASDTSITDLAFTLGYSSSQHFCTRFKQEKGISPNQYRKRIEMY